MGIGDNPAGRNSGKSREPDQFNGHSRYTEEERDGEERDGEEEGHGVCPSAHTYGIQSSGRFQ